MKGFKTYLAGKENRKDEQETVTKLQRKLDLLENDSAATRRIAQIERESKITKINLSMAQARFDLIAKGFDDLLIAINEMAVSDPEAFKLSLIQTNQFIKKTSEKLKRIEKAASEVPAKPFVFVSFPISLRRLTIR